MKKGLLLIVALFFCCFSLAHAAETGTKKEAMAMVKKAVAYYSQNGQEKALKEFMNPKGKFVYKDLFIYAIDTNGNCIAHVVTPSIVGKNFLQIKDSKGFAFVKEMIHVGEAKGSGWVNYHWSHPKTRKIVPKTAYVEKVGNIIVSCAVNK